jgi:putative ABC transport system permease protein
MAREPLWRRYRRFWESNPRADLDDELAFHLAMRTEEFRRAGHDPDEAEGLAMQRFGDLERIRRECHDLGTRRAARKQRAFRWDAMKNDLRYALRMLRLNSGFSLAVIITMALGIGATTAVFSVAYGVLLRPLPYHDADALVRLWSRRADRNLDFFSISPADYKDWKAQSTVFAGMGAFERQREAVLSRGGEPEAVVVAAVSPDIFALLGTKAALGRSIDAEDARAGAAVVVLEYDTWATQFGRDSTLIGRDILLDGRAHRVVGVMPPRFFVPGSPAPLWTPLSLEGAPTDHSNRYLRVLARLAPGVSLDRARAELDLIATRLANGYPATNAGWSINTMAVTEMIIGSPFRRAVLVLLGVVGFVLLIACANAANLQLARATSRRREIAVRSALGASRGRIIALLLAESALLGVIAGAVGLALAYGGLELLRTVGVNTVPRLDDVRLDMPVLAFTAVVALGSGILFGLVPALRASRSDLAETLKEGSRGSVGGAMGEGARGGLVITEVTLSLILLIGAALLMRSFVRLQSVETGFDPRGVVVIPFRLPESSYPEPTQTAAFHASLLERARAIPGVRAAAATSGAPFAGANTGNVFARVDRPPVDRQSAPDADFRVVTPGYLATMGIRLVRGSDFTAEHGVNAPPAAIISESMARLFWPNEDPIGGRLRMGDIVRGPVITVIGVAADARYQSLETPDARPMLYFAASAASAALDAPGASHDRSSLCDVGHPPRGGHARSGVAAATGADPRRSRTGGIRHAPLRARPVRNLRRSRDAARRRGHLRRDGLPRPPADPRARHPCRPRCAAGPAHGPRRGTRDADDGRRCCPRPARRLDAHAVAGHPALRHQRDRRHDVRRGRRARRRDRPCGERRAGPEGDERGSNGRPTRRVNDCALTECAVHSGGMRSSKMTGL